MAIHPLWPISVPSSRPRRVSMAGVNGWYSAIGWNQPGIASTGMKALEMSGSRISGIALLLAASAFGLTRPMPTAIQVSASGEEHEQPERRQPLQGGGVRGPEADGHGDGADEDHADDRLQHAADDVPDEHRAAVDRHRAEAGDDALGHVVGDGHRGPDRGAADGHQQHARDEIGDVLGAVGAAAADARAHRVAEDVDEEQQQHDRREQQVQGEGRVAPRVQEVAAQHRGRVAYGEGEGAHRTVSLGWSGLAVAGAAGEGEEHVVEVGGVHGQLVRLDAGRVEPVEDGAQLALAAVAGDLQRQCLVVAGDLAQCGGGGLVRGRVGEAEPDVSAGDQPLQLLGGALGGDLAVVEHGDAVGEFVGLVQVLRGEEDGDAVGDELADDLPHVVAGARVEAGGRLVEEDDPRVADQGHGDVEAALHAAGVGGGGLLRGLDEVEALQQFGGDPPPLALGAGGAGRP